MSRIYNVVSAATVSAMAACLLAACEQPSKPVEPQSANGSDASASADSAADSTAKPADDMVVAHSAETSRAGVTLQSASGSNVTGSLSLTEKQGLLHITGDIHGLKPGVHGFHVHEIGDCSAPDASSAGGHYAPGGSPHGAPTQPHDMHHAGDLGNIVADADGNAPVDIIDDELTLSGPATIVGRAIVVHADADDLTSQPSGNAGSRVACGVVESGDGSGA